MPASAPIARLSLAPLRGVTLAPFRRELAARFGGIDEALAPFVALPSSNTPNKLPVRMFADVLPDACGEIPTLPQLIGRDPAAMREACRILRDLGFTRVNLNCGCPWKFVAKKGRGSGLPENADSFRRMLEAGCEGMPGGFSVKIRLGYATTETLAARASMLNEFPIEHIVVHPRTGVQMYEGEVHLDAFERVLPLLKMPVVYNGDIYTVDDARRILARFPSVAGLMLGRGLCRDPFLAHDIAHELFGAPARTETAPRHEMVAAFAKTLRDHYESVLFGPAPLLGRMKELFGWLHSYFENGDEGLRKIQRAATVAECDAAIARLVEGSK